MTNQRENSGKLFFQISEKTVNVYWRPEWYFLYENAKLSENICFIRFLSAFAYFSNMTDFIIILTIYFLQHFGPFSSSKEISFGKKPKQATIFHILFFMDFTHWMIVTCLSDSPKIKHQLTTPKILAREVSCNQI